MAAKKAKILIVEDDEFLAGMYVTKLTKEGFDVVLASDGEDALVKVKEKPVLILLDILLPKKDGFTVLKELKSDAATRNIPVILLTNLGEKEDVDHGLSLGAADYLIKAHFMPIEVIEKINALLKK